MGTPTPRAGFDAADTWVCACRHIRRQAFIETVKQQQLTTIDAVRQVTAINTSCGICYETVQSLLDEINGS
ncbi:(2Fe-2S)-binding protein [uncultured Amphritea sp.]|uniref:(2Fe-2S)-binding protein n=1 Tax=uncultured Amphritea sp. TaxID=981605 RepID=UPI002628C138|nr:(2Fe-2S)-binding protein [uncultured Amphritea sp.]